MNDGPPAIDPRAVVHPGARLARGVTVGPYCVIGEHVSVGERTQLASHVVIEGPTELGPDNVISPMAALGGPPQDLKYGGEPTRLIIGSRNRIREFTTLHRGTAAGRGVTRVGDDNLLMAYVHIAHDCEVGSRTIFGNAATLAGHVEVGDGATVGAFSGVHQFCRVAPHAFIGGYSVVVQDALPWVLTVGNRAKSFGLNLVGLKRAKMPQATIDALKRCYATLFRSKLPLEDALGRVEAEYGHVPEVAAFVGFVRSSRRGICR
ncbi:MAG TPA: acyl-ACP--UDP-N-acetylglucosamine O-acyltransferase [Candidatus Polarisedimenticolaceae bacterium]|nr:acyl-ACP--UDP-N-acetylglucosamine O-acyltransferase [Candidatus Polarisedimenticolaceae bacterium]